MVEFSRLRCDVRRFGDGGLGEGPRTAEENGRLAINFVANFEVFHIRPHHLYYSGRITAHCGRQLHLRQIAGTNLPVDWAHPRGVDADPNFAGFGFRQGNVFNSHCFGAAYA